MLGFMMSVSGKWGIDTGRLMLACRGDTLSMSVIAFSELHNLNWLGRRLHHVRCDLKSRENDGVKVC